jgi:hypothetical protein
MLVQSRKTARTVPRKRRAGRESSRSRSRWRRTCHAASSRATQVNRRKVSLTRSPRPRRTPKSAEGQDRVNPLEANQLARSRGVSRDVI